MSIYLPIIMGNFKNKTYFIFTLCKALGGGLYLIQAHSRLCLVVPLLWWSLPHGTLFAPNHFNSFALVPQG